MNEVFNHAMTHEPGPAASATATAPEAAAVYLGEVDFAQTWQLQQSLAERRVRGEIPDLLLLLQHPDVITVGRRQRAQANILDPRFPVFEVERGGDATYHGPGQLVGYPIVLLRPAQDQGEGDPLGPHGERDLHRYLRDLETAIMDLCAECGIVTTRKPDYTGVWTADTARKLASLGIAVRRWVTFHGFALNVATDLTRFHAINPCGLEARVMTSLVAEGGMLDGRPVSVESLIELAAEHVGRALRRRFVLRGRAALGI